MLGSRLNERYGTIHSDASLLNAKCRRKEPDHHSIRLDIREPGSIRKYRHETPIATRNSKPCRLGLVAERSPIGDRN